MKTSFAEPSFLSWAQNVAPPFLLSEDFTTAVTLGWRGGLSLANFTILGTLLLELLSLPTVRGVLSQKPDGRSLYLTAWFLNFRNHYLLGIPVYTVAVTLFSRRETDDDTETKSLLFSAWSVFGVVFLHSLCYYYAHKTLHKPRYYQYHRFHHRFNKYIPPSSANAVTFVEYLMAYVVPFAICTLLVHPTESELRLAVYIVTTCNLTIHTPRLEKLSEQWMPRAFSSAYLHMEHHRKLTINYAAPTLNIDWIVAKLEEFAKKNWQQRTKKVN
jgi:sterol desaturase/sphingolipid hydroxylase (fatty acid hydroxylase superfamily)